MNIIEKKIRQKEIYLNGLHKIVSDAKETAEREISLVEQQVAQNENAIIELPDGEDSQIMLDYLHYQLDYIKFQFEIYLPLTNILNYIHFCNLNRISKSEILEIFNKRVIEIPDWESIYDELLQLDPPIRDFYIANIDCNAKTKSSLSAALNTKHRESFINCIYESKENLSVLKNIVDAYNYILNSQVIGKELTQAVIDKQIGKNDVFEIIEENVIGQYQLSASLNQDFSSKKILEEGFSYIQELQNDGDISTLQKIKKFSYKSLFLYIVLRDQLVVHKSEFSDEEQEVINNFIVSDNDIDLYKRAAKEGYRYEITDDSQAEMRANPDESFDNLAIFENRPESDKTQYFNGLNSVIVAGGDNKFKEFVNYIADSGYIDNTSEAKQLFTFRLTGRCKPSGELPKLLWDGKENRSPNELIFIIRFATDNSKKKYRKMEAFFDGPIFPDKDISAYADQARKEFRVKLCEFYPGVFRIKDISQY